MNLVKKNFFSTLINSCRIPQTFLFFINKSFGHLILTCWEEYSFNIQNNLNTQTKKVTVNFSIDKNLYEQFKRVAQKDMRKYSNIVEGSMRRYVRSKL